MTDDVQRQATTGNDNALYTMTLHDVARRFDAEGMPKTVRTLQRYCASNRLDCFKTMTLTGFEYLADPTSVERAIAELRNLQQAASSTDMPRHVGHSVEHPTTHDEPRPVATSRDNDVPEHQERQVATEPDAKWKDDLILRQDGLIEFLKDQVKIKDVQIGELIERSHESNSLFAGLQKMLSPLLGRGNDTTADKGENGGRDVQ